MTPSYSAIMAWGEGTQRQIERMEVDDIRKVLHDHRSFVLLAHPDAGKTMALKWIALDKAFAHLRA